MAARLMWARCCSSNWLRVSSRSRPTNSVFGIACVLYRPNQTSLIGLSALNTRSINSLRRVSSNGVCGLSGHLSIAQPSD